MIRVLALVAVAAMLAGCAPEAGTVTSTRWSYVYVRTDAGAMHSHKVRHSVALRCHVGARWPDCQR